MRFMFVEHCEIKDILDLKLKQEVIDFLIKNNAGTPKNRELHINGRIYVFNNVLNFNPNSKYENVRDYIKNLKDILDNEIPFGRDGFGNIYLVDLDSCLVRFYEHESGNKIELLPFNSFVKLFRMDDDI
ncbi:MAG: SMI1/KNR4 family protein [Helicobacter trogontum]|uniref:SMI1/KNR4 family protein n=1 Tax=Helicobacter trogontum TaxID=50960 RepID=A0A4U8TI49_9HELI|nr:SMI1/KNR4 family protein [Helicobacter trogontum]MCI5786130.1 SMI1/KNR4 family protein [Helicobacter trogontum]TLD99384.1 SMI1/KNR4 family protein [Helicobacter trogontum]